MKLSEYMKTSDTVFFDITNIETPLEPTLHYIVEKIDVLELAQFCSDLQSLCNLWRLNESEDASPRVKRMVSMLASCLLVDYLQCHAEVIRELMKAPVPVITEDKK